MSRKEVTASYQALTAVSHIWHGLSSDGLSRKEVTASYQALTAVSHLWHGLSADGLSRKEVRASYQALTAVSHIWHGLSSYGLSRREVTAWCQVCIVVQKLYEVGCPVISKGPNRVGVSLPSPEAGNRSSFWTVVFSGYLQLQTIDKAYKPSESEKKTRML
jgi:hypothetical protein